MYASPVSLLRLRPPRRKENRGKFAPAVRGRPPELRLRGVYARRSHSGGFWPLKKGGCSGEKFTCGLQVYGWERFTIRGAYDVEKSSHMLNFTYEDDLKLKKKHVAGVSRTFYLSTEAISRPPQSRETIPLRHGTL
jgi:hypothetical protein